MESTFRSTREAVAATTRLALRPMLALLVLALLVVLLIDLDAVIATAGSSPAVFVVLSVPVALLFLSTIAFLAMSLAYRFARLTISPEGLRYERWPFATLTARWDEVDRIVTGSFGGRPFATMLVWRRTIGLEVSLGTARFGSAKYQGIPLQDFEGWADRTLEAAIVEFAPRLAAPDHHA